MLKNKIIINWAIYSLLVFAVIIIITAWRFSVVYAEKQIQEQAKKFLVSDDDPFLGSPQAKVHIVEFSDFQCPFCQKASPVMKELMRIYGDKIHFVYRDSPIASHPYSQKAAEAGECAQEQGKFWELHDQIFANQQDLKDIKKIALKTGVDMIKFNECLDSNRYQQEVQEDYELGKKAGVKGTPTFFVNGEIIAGMVPLEVIMEMIGKYLK